jgi:hypothetical protein
VGPQLAAGRGHSNERFPIAEFGFQDALFAELRHAAFQICVIETVRISEVPLCSVSIAPQKAHRGRAVEENVEQDQVIVDQPCPVRAEGKITHWKCSFV